MSHMGGIKWPLYMRSHDPYSDPSGCQNKWNLVANVVMEGREGKKGRGGDQLGFGVLMSPYCNSRNFFVFLGLLFNKKITFYVSSKWQVQTCWSNIFFNTELYKICSKIYFAVCMCCFLVNKFLVSWKLAIFHSAETKHRLCIIYSTHYFVVNLSMS